MFEITADRLFWISFSSFIFSLVIVLVTLYYFHVTAGMTKVTVLNAVDPVYLKPEYLHKIMENQRPIEVSELPSHPDAKGSMVSYKGAKYIWSGATRQWIKI